MRNEAQFLVFLKSSVSRRTGRAMKPRAVTDVVSRCNRVERLLRIDLYTELSRRGDGIEALVEQLRTNADGLGVVGKKKYYELDANRHGLFRHAHGGVSAQEGLMCGGQDHKLLNGQTIRCWGGPGRVTTLMNGAEWMPYQPPSFPTPPFPEYPSGHSTFSAAGARVLKLWTGSDRFGYSVTLASGSSRIESGRLLRYRTVVHNVR